MHTPIHQIAELQEARAQARAEAEALGVTEAFISDLVETFYTRVRAHPELGPIFAKEIGDQWEPHLAKMKRFWSSIILRTNTYDGRPMPAHMKLTGVSQKNFTQWLELFQATLTDLAPNPEVTQLFHGRAETIATRLSSMMNLVPDA